MKVIILGTAWPYRGGLAAFNERLAMEYLKRGDEVEIVTFTMQYPSFLFPGKTQYSTEPAPAGLKIKRMLNSVNPFNWLKVGRYIKKRKPDLLITKFWLPFMAPALGTVNRVAKSHNIFRISILDNIIPHEKRIGDKLFAKYFVCSVDGMVAMSQSVLVDVDQFDSQNKKPRKFCAHPLYDHYGEPLSKEDARSLLSLDKNGRYVLFFGFIRDYKGLDLLLEAMADRRLKEMDVKLVVAGEFYGNKEKYMALIDRLGISGQVVLHTDFIPDSEVNRYFCAADLVAQPYRSATQSGVTQIAFNFCKPMLVTNVGGLPEIVPDGKVGLVVEPDSHVIADGIVKYFNDNLEKQLTEGTIEERKKYMWSRMVETIDGIKINNRKLGKK
ncbi:MAG: glycosyltransferase [Bacteroidales bacterium]|nr:glycosyltransferase [Bacteroidales bacterium]MBQ6742574.1 glycosyltransferase [Bacteroidales bacterium]MBQ6742599.1 glycosyltransferase [Bacteroidales bacterium]